MIMNTGYWIFDIEYGYGYWILDIGYWKLDTGYWILDTRYWILDTGHWILDSEYGYWILNTGSWILDIWYMIMDTGYWILDTEYRYGYWIWILDTGFYIDSLLFLCFQLIQSQEVYNVFLFSMYIVIYYVEYIGYIYIYILNTYIQGEQKKDRDWHFPVLIQSF